MTRAAAVVSVAFQTIVLGQSGDLHEDVKRLAVRHSTTHYELSGTVSDERLLEFGRCLEFIYKEYAAGFEELLPKKEGTSVGSNTRNGAEFEPSPNSDSNGTRFPVLIFATAAQYQEFGGRYFGGREEHTRGLYVPAVRLLMILDEGLSSETYEVLFHEAFHQFMHRYLPSAPLWVNEGLATYFGTARVTPSGLALDRPRSAYFDTVASAASARRLIPLAELLNANAAAFYNGETVPGVDTNRSALHYAQSYTLVTYMLSDSGGRDHLRQYLRSLAVAKDPGEANEITQRTFPEPLLSAMVTAWLHFVNRH